MPDSIRPAVATPPAGPFIPVYVAGIFLILLGLVVISGWVLHEPRLILLVPGYGGMPYSTAIGFLLAGLALMVREVELRRRQGAASMPASAINGYLGALFSSALGLLGLLAVIDWATGFDPLGLSPDPQMVHRWLADPNDIPATTRPLAAAALAAFGAVTGFVPSWSRNANRLLLAQGLGLFVLFVGALGLAGELAGFSEILRWFIGPVLSSGIAFLVAGLGLLALVRTWSFRTSGSGEGSVDQIGFMAGIIVVVAGMLGILGGFATLYPQTRAAMENNLVLSLKYRSELLEGAIRQAWLDGHNFANQPLRLKAMKTLDGHPGDSRARLEIQNVADRYQAFGFSAVAFFDARGRLVAQAGAFIATSRLTVPLKTPQPSRLSWDDGFVLQARTDMIDGGEIVGRLESERRLPLPNLHDTAHFGDTLDFPVCAPAGPERTDCFPFRSTQGEALRDLPLTLYGARIPISYPLEGRTGIVHTNDYRGVRVIAAYQPVGNLGLAADLKIDADQLYAPIARRLQPLFLVLLAVGGGAIVLLRLQVMPLLRKLTGEIAERRRVEAELERSRTDLAEITANLGEGVYVLDPQGRLTFINPEAERLLGWRADEIVGKDGHAAFHARHPDGSALSLDDCRVHQAIRSASTCRVALDWFQRKDGSFLPVTITASPLVHDGVVRGAVVAFTDVSQRLAQEQALRESEEKFRSASAAAQDAFIMIDGKGHITFWNSAAEKIFGYRAEEVLGRELHPLLAPEADAPERQAAFARFSQTGAGNAVGTTLELTAIRKGGETFPIEISVSAAKQGDQWMAIGIVRDITERKRAEAAQAALNRALRLVSECNSELVRATREQALLAAICRLVVDSGGYRMAWVGMAEDDAGKTVRVTSSYGHIDGYLDDIRISWGDNEHGRGPTGTAIRTGLTQVNQDYEHNPRTQPWRANALAHGYRASIALPLKADEAAFGALTIYASAPNAFAPGEVELLEQLAADLAFGIAAMRTEEARKQALAGQQRSEERFRLVLDNAADAVFVADRDGRYVYVNHQATRLLGYSQRELLQLRIADVAAPADLEHALAGFTDLQRQGQLTTELSLLRRDGSSVPVELNAIMLPDGTAYGACRDITERRNYETQLEYGATHDPLTGLANRNLLADRLGQSIAHARRAGRSVAVMLLDIDRFKLVNDSLGHETGDALLQEVAKGLSACVRGGDTVARQGGDEFMIVMTDMAAEDDAAALARKLLDRIAQPLLASRHELLVTASLGIAVFPRDGDTVGDLIKNADVAMYRAKELGRNSFQFYAPEMNARMLERLELETGLRRALAQNELELHYQPKVELRRGSIVGAEALIRWRHPVAGMVTPADFIPLAEETGLIIPIGEWVIETACRQLRTWHEAGLDDLTVAVNISARQFQHANLAAVVSRALQDNGLPAPRLELEVTETAIMMNPAQAAQTLQALKRIGVRISLDDFGTGYSSLNYLKRFPIDSLKIDRSFVDDVVVNPDDAAIAKLVIALGRDLGHKVIAEGVETEAQLSFLRRHHCDEMQGYLFSHPLSDGEFIALLREERHLPGPAEADDGKRTLLIVDDEPGILASLKRLLRAEGYRILTASSATEALGLLAQNQVQVVISDQRMPEMTGTDFLNRVWQMYPDTVRILLTGYTDIDSVTEAVNRGAILKFLTKPWDDARLREHVRDAFRYHEAMTAG